MNPFRRFCITFGSVLLIGGVAFISQTRRLGEIRQQVGSRSTAADKAAMPLDEIPPSGKSTTRPAASAPHLDSDQADKFIEKLKTTLAASLTEKQLTVFMNVGGKERIFEALAAAVNLARDENANIREELEKYNGERAALYLDHDLTPAALASGLADITRRQDEWLAGQLGTERYASLIHYKEQQSRASAKERAADSVSRIDSATDLTDEQRQKLHKEFLELNLRPTPPPENKLVVETTANLSVGPSVPDLSGEVEKILTPEQLAHYQAQREATAKNAENQSDVMMGMIESLLPAVIDLIDEDP